MICVSTNTRAAWKLDMQMSAYYVCTPLEKIICFAPPLENFCRRPWILATFSNCSQKHWHRNCSVYMMNSRPSISQTGCLLLLHIMLFHKPVPADMVTQSSTPPPKYGAPLCQFVYVKFAPVLDTNVPTASRLKPSIYTQSTDLSANKNTWICQCFTITAGRVRTSLVLSQSNYLHEFLPNRNQHSIVEEVKDNLAIK